MNRTFRRSFFALTAATLFLAACVALGATPSAEPAEWGTARTVVVDTADLDLATPVGRSRLLRRVADAVDRVCDLPNGEQLGQRARVAACKAEARAQADARVAGLIEAARPLARRR